MAKTDITQERVNAIAEALVAEGLKPGARNIRQRLGNKGSPNTILKFIQNWQSGNNGAPTAAAEIVLPTALQKVLVEFIGKSVEEGKASLQEDLLEAQQLQSELIAEHDELSADLVETIAKRNALKTENAALVGKADVLSDDLLRINVQLDLERSAAENARISSSVLKAKLEASEVAEAKTYNDLQLSKIALTEVNYGLAKSNFKIDELNVAVALKDQLLVAKDKELQSSFIERVDIAEKLTDAEIDLKAAMDRLTNERQAAEAVRTEVAVLKVKFDASEANCAAVNAQLNAMKAEFEASKVAMKALIEEAAQLKGHLAAVLEVSKEKVIV